MILLNLRNVSLLAMCVHYSLLTVFLHVSRTSSPTPYKASAAVLVTEFGKLLLSCVLAYRDARRTLQDAAESAPASPATSPVPSAAPVTTIHSAFSQPDRHRRGDSISASFSPAASSPSTRRLNSSSQDLGAKSSDSKERRPPDSSSQHLSLHFQESRPADHVTSGECSSSPSVKHIVNLVWNEAFAPNWWTLALPAILYTIQANLQYLASSNLSVPAFQITYQLKILTTALCSVVLLNRTLSPVQWTSLFLLTVGVALVQLGSTAPTHHHDVPPISSTSTSSESIPIASVVTSAARMYPTFAKDSNERLPSIPRPRLPPIHKEEEQMNQTLGLAAVTLACLSSGFASTYFERKLKVAEPQKVTSTENISVVTSSSSPQVSPPPKLPGLWIRNIQLSVFGVAMSVFVMFFESNKSVIFAYWSGLLSTSSSISSYFQLNQDTSASFLSSSSSSSFSFNVFNFSSLFEGFTPIVYFVVFLQILGGLIAALVIKHADNIAKGFATSLSIILSFLASVLLFDFTLNLYVILGSAFVIFATWLFSSKAPSSFSSSVSAPASASSSGSLMKPWEFLGISSGLRWLSSFRTFY